MPAGRPTVYNQTIADEICDRLASGESLRSICNGPPNYDPLVDDDNHSHLPNIKTVLSWALNLDHEFHPQYDEARRAQQECYADELYEIPEKLAHNIPQARLLSDNIKWTASRLSSRRFGDRLQTQITDADGESFGAGAVSQLANLIASAASRKKTDADDDLA